MDYKWVLISWFLEATHIVSRLISPSVGLLAISLLFGLQWELAIHKSYFGKLNEGI